MALFLADMNDAGRDFVIAGDKGGSFPSPLSFVFPLVVFTLGDPMCSMGAGFIDAVLSFLERMDSTEARSTVAVDSVLALAFDVASIVLLVSYSMKLKKIR